MVDISDIKQLIINDIVSIRNEVLTDSTNIIRSEFAKDGVKTDVKFNKGSSIVTANVESENGEQYFNNFIQSLNDIDLVR